MAPDRSRRPLIDPIIHDRDFDVSDEEDTFYAIDEGDSLLHPKLRAMISRTTSRVPRRLQRYLIIYIPLAIILTIAWLTYFGKVWAAYRQEMADMNAAAQLTSTRSARPAFQDMAQVKDLDTQYLPKGDGRLVVVGDVHGCLEELEKLLKKVGFQENKDHLVLTGDIVAKGPDSPGVVSLADRLHASCVRGNHEDKVLLSLTESKEFHAPKTTPPDVPAADYADPEEPRPYIEEFLISTLPPDASGAENKPGSPAKHVSNDGPSALSLAKSFNNEQLSYLKSCPVILHVGQIGRLNDVVVVHAGLVPDVPLERQDPFQVMNMRTIDLHTLLPSETRKHTVWEKYWNHQQKRKPENEQTTVIYGHDRKRGKNIKKFSMGLDSGCVAGGYLTAMVIEESGKHRFVQQKCKGYVANKVQ